MGARSGGGGGAGGGGAAGGPKFAEGDYWGRKKGVPNAGMGLGMDSVRASFAQGKTVQFIVTKDFNTTITPSIQAKLKSIGAKPYPNGQWTFKAKTMSGLVRKSSKLGGLYVSGTVWND